jgi:hypothetical protein
MPNFWKAFFRGFALLAVVCLAYHQSSSFKINNMDCGQGTHETLTRDGLNVTPGMGGTNKNLVIQYVDDSDYPDPYPSGYHFKSTWYESASLVLSLQDICADYTVGGGLPDRTYFFMGLLMHLVEDFYAHSNWAYNFAHSFLDPLPDFTLLTAPQGWTNSGYDYDCANSDLPEVLASLEVRRQFQTYLKHCYERNPSQAEAKVATVFPGVVDLGIGWVSNGVIGMPSPATWSVNGSPQLVWNNFTNDPVTLQLRQNGVALGTISTRSGSEFYYYWYVFSQLTNGIRVNPDVGYTVRLIRGSRSSETSVFGVHGIRLTSPTPGAQLIRGSAQTLVFRSYMPGNTGTWNLSLQGRITASIGSIVIDNLGVRNYSFPWVAGRTTGGYLVPVGGYNVIATNGSKSYTCGGYYLKD